LGTVRLDSAAREESRSSIKPVQATANLPAFHEFASALLYIAKLSILSEAK